MENTWSEKFREKVKESKVVVSCARMRADKIQPHDEYSYLFKVTYRIIKVKYDGFIWPFRHILVSDFNEGILARLSGGQRANCFLMFVYCIDGT